MQLQSCLGAGVVVTAPPERDEPEEMWVDARDQRVIPVELYDFYRTTHYLSPSGIAGWSTDAAKVVSGYFSRSVRSVAECLIEAADLKAQMLLNAAEMYTPLKKIRCETWDPQATRKFRSAFRLWLIDLVGAVDSLAEIIAIILPGAIRGVDVTRGASGPFLKWASRPLTASSGLVSPVSHHAECLHAAVHPHVALVASHDWLGFVRMYRNKMTHFGHQAFLNYGLQCGTDGNIYYFLPREWPFNPERYMSADAPPQSTDDPSQLDRHLQQSLAHVDIVTFLGEASTHFNALIGAAVGALSAAFIQLRVLHVNDIAALIQANTKQYEFVGFASGAG